MSMREMRQSGVEWIGQIPSSWNIKRLKYICSITTGDSDTQDSIADGKYPFYVRSPVVERSDHCSFEGEAILMAGDGAGAGRIFHYATGKMAIHQRVYCLYKIKEIMPQFLFLFLQSTFCHQMDRGSAQSTVPSVRLPMLKNFYIPIPPLVEQKQIIEFLENKFCTQIDALTADIEKQIETLQEYKKSLINEAVTKGLDPNVGLKVSGFEDIGVIPTNWEAVPFRQNFSFSRGLKITKAKLIEKGIPCISYGNIHSKYNRFVNPLKDDLPCVSEEYIKFNKKSLLNKGDFVFADTSEDLDGAGNFSCVKEQSLLFAGYHTIICRNKNDSLDSNFLAYLFDSTHFRKQIQKMVCGIKVFSITQTILKSLKIWVPPIQEQRLISKYLDCKCAEIDFVLSAKNKQLEDLSKYKQSLIYEYVTGKKTVPNA